MYGFHSGVFQLLVPTLITDYHYDEDTNNSRQVSSEVLIKVILDSLSPHCLDDSTCRVLERSVSVVFEAHR